ncbi:MAG: hypothetical protein HY208_01450 [Nitrospirae bacterium]|nr:hypothetical protein [Nitrospirota bacterium]
METERGGRLTACARRRALPAALLVFALAGCQSAPPNPASSLPTCGTVAVEQVLDRRTLRLADGKLVELAMPQLFLQPPSPDQPDYFALNQTLVASLKEHLEGHTVTADLADAKLMLCGEDLVSLGTAWVSQGLLFVEQTTGPIDPDTLTSWKKLEYGARQNRLGLWKKGNVGAAPFDRVARLTSSSLTGEQAMDEITFNGNLPGRGVTLAPERLAQFHAIVADSAITLLPRSSNFWRLCCDVGGSWFRVYYPRKGNNAQTADYIESPELETFFRQVIDDTSGANQ